jgi:chromosome segregation ATPase
MAIGKLVKLLMKKGPTQATKKLEAKDVEFPEENLDLIIQRIQEVKPDLGKESQPPSAIRKTIDKYSDKYQEYKDNTPEAKRKLQQRLDNLKRIQEEEEAQFKKEALDNMEREERRKKVRFVPKTEIIEDK